MFTEVINQHKSIANNDIQVVNITESQQKHAQTNNIDFPDIAISLTPVGLVFSWVIFFIIYVKFVPS